METGASGPSRIKGNGADEVTRCCLLARELITSYNSGGVLKSAIHYTVCCKLVLEPIANSPLPRCGTSRAGLACTGLRTLSWGLLTWPAPQRPTTPQVSAKERRSGTGNRLRRSAPPYNSQTAKYCAERKTAAAALSVLVGLVELAQHALVPTHPIHPRTVCQKPRVPSGLHSLAPAAV